MDDVIRAILKEHGQLDVDADTIGEDEDLYRNGLTSHATVNVMLGLEDEYDFEFPDRSRQVGIVPCRRHCAPHWSSFSPVRKRWPLLANSRRWIERRSATRNS